METFPTGQFPNQTLNRPDISPPRHFPDQPYVLIMYFEFILDPFLFALTIIYETIEKKLLLSSSMVNKVKKEIKNGYPSRCIHRMVTQELTKDVLY